MDLLRLNRHGPEDSADAGGPRPEKYQLEYYSSLRAKAKDNSCGGGVSRIQIVGHLTFDDVVLLNNSYAIANGDLSFGWFESPANVLCFCRSIGTFSQPSEGVGSFELSFEIADEPRTATRIPITDTC